MRQRYALEDRTSILSSLARHSKTLAPVERDVFEEYHEVDSASAAQK